jgi:hypothetical protein
MWELQWPIIFGLFSKNNRLLQWGCLLNYFFSRMNRGITSLRTRQIFRNISFAEAGWQNGWFVKSQRGWLQNTGWAAAMILRMKWKMQVQRVHRRAFSFQLRRRRCSPTCFSQVQLVYLSTTGCGVPQGWLFGISLLSWSCYAIVHSKWLIKISFAPMRW